MKVLFIKPEEVSIYTPLGGNIDVDKVLPSIYDVQISVIESMLGEALYEKILVDFTDGVLVGDYLKLVDDYVKPIMRYQAAAEFIEIGTYWVSNAGIFRKNPEGTSEVSKSEVDALAQTLRTKAQMYIERCERFLAKANLPEYSRCSKHNTLVSQGWYFP